MSTDLYRVRVLDLSPDTRTVTFRVFLVYYDWGGVPTDASFFFRILVDNADLRLDPDAPLGHEVTRPQYLDEAWVDANTHRFVERVTQTALHNSPPGKKIPTFIHEGFTDEDSLTQGDYEVIVTDVRWMQHLTKGQTWATTSYATHAQMPHDRQTLTIEGQLRAARLEATRKKRHETKATRDLRNTKKKAAVAPPKPTAATEPTKATAARRAKKPATTKQVKPTKTTAAKTTTAR